MTGSSLSNAPETIVGPLRDEAALERLFRTHFSTLCDEAKEHLGEPAASAAPKVVEASFRQAWDEREHIASEADLATLPSRSCPAHGRARAESSCRRSASRRRCAAAAAHHAANRRDRCRSGVAAPNATAAPRGRARRSAGVLRAAAPLRGGARRRSVEGALLEGSGHHRGRRRPRWPVARCGTSRTSVPIAS